MTKPTADCPNESAHAGSTAQKEITKYTNHKNDSDICVSQIIKAAKGILIVGHINPDGDCFGSGLALKNVCERLGKAADFVCDSPLSSAYSFMEGFDTINHPVLSDYDTVFAVDCGDEFRLGKYLSLMKKAKLSVNIDHHYSNNLFSKYNKVDKSASSTCQILADLILKEGLMNTKCAEYLFVGLSTDTGHFSHSNTDKTVFDLASRLLDFGVNNYEIVKNLYKSKTLEKTRLIGKAINTIRLESGVAVIALTAADLAGCGCTFSDTEGLIDFAINIKSVEAAVCITESAKNSYKVSFRSKTESILSAAESFGGGGHKYAAGCMVFGCFEDVIEKVRKAVLNALTH